MRLIRVETPLGLFSILWALAASLHHLELRPAGGLLLYPFAVLLLVFPERISALIVFAVAHVAILFIDFPAASNHSVLSLLVDLGVLMACVAVLPGTPSNLRSQKLWEGLRGPMQATVLVVYGYAVFHKLNSSFFDPEVSCATDQILKMIGMHGFSGSPRPSAFSLNIYVTLALELAILIFLLWPKLIQIGLVLGLLFHIGLGWARFFDFATVVFALYLFFLPWDTLQSRIARIPRWAGASFVVGLGLFAALSAYFHGIRGDPTILAGMRWSLQVDTLLCLLWTVMIWPILFPLFVGRWQVAGNRRWTGARLAWTIPVIALANGATSYLGLKTVANYSMFSNLRTEGGRTNHFFVPAGRFFLANYQNDLVEVWRFQGRPPERWPLSVRLVGGMRWVRRQSRWLREVPRARVPLFEVRRTVQLWKDIGFTDLVVLYERDGELYAPADPYSDPELMRPMPRWQRKLLAFRAVQEDGEECECRW